MQFDQTPKGLREMIGYDSTAGDANDPMTNEGLGVILQDIEARRAPIKAAMKRIDLILTTDPYLVDDQGFVVCMNDALLEAQLFIRDNFDLNGMGLASDSGYDNLPIALATKILEDLKIIWDDEFSRDRLSEWAMGMSLCPMHFVDWAICFDDDDVQCRAIRKCFPNSHDT